MDDSEFERMEIEDLPHRCARCKELKPRSAFAENRRYKSGLQSYCRECMKAHQRDSTKGIPWRETAQGRAWKRYDLKKKYGITLEEYETRWEAQEGKCAICKQPPQPTRALGVDHNHTTGEVRGLLCEDCNWGLGKFRDNPELLKAAAEYLETYNGHG